jgi:hypothetical protein
MVAAWSQSIRVIGPIDEVSQQPTAAEIARRGDTATPLIIRDFLAHDAVREATARVFDGAAADATCTVYVSRNGQFPGGDGPYDPDLYRMARMSLRECRARMLEPGAHPVIHWTNERYYLYQAPAALMQSVRDAIELPASIPYVDRRGTNNAWMSQPGNLTPPHIDFYENLLVEVAGTKRVLLWDAAQASRLYIKPFGRAASRQSQVDLEAPDLRRLPRFADARALAGDLRPGDALYIPFDCIHAIRSVDFCISMNFWWGARRQRFGRLLRSRAMPHFFGAPIGLAREILAFVFSSRDR